METIESMIKTFNEKKDIEYYKKRRTCALPTIMANDAEVLGKVGRST